MNPVLEPRWKLFLLSRMLDERKSDPRILQEHGHVSVKYLAPKGSGK